VSRPQKTGRERFQTGNAEKLKEKLSETVIRKKGGDWPRAASSERGASWTDKKIVSLE